MTAGDKESEFELALSTSGDTESQFPVLERSDFDSCFGRWTKMSGYGGSSHVRRSLDAIEQDDEYGYNHNRGIAGRGPLALTPTGDNDDLARILDSGADEPLLQKLTRFWMDERNAPDILISQGLVIEETLNKLQEQSEMVEHLQNDPRTSEEEHFRIVLIQTEAERVKFLVRSYLRTRLHKIEQFAAHIISTPELRGRLSEIELSHAEKYNTLLATHFHSSALSGVPEQLRTLDDEDENGLNMVSRPNKNQAVFVRARRRCDPVGLPDGETLEMEKGDIHLVRYATIEGLLKAGDVECV